MVNSGFYTGNSRSGYDSKYGGGFFQRDENDIASEYLHIIDRVNKNEEESDINNIVLNELISFISFKIISLLVKSSDSPRRIIALENFFQQNPDISVGDKFKIITNIFCRKSYSTQEKLAFYNEVNNNQHIDNSMKIAILKKVLNSSEIKDKKLRRHIKNKITLLEIVEKSNFVMDFSQINAKLARAAVRRSRLKKKNFNYVVAGINSEITLKLDALASLAEQGANVIYPKADHDSVLNTDKPVTAKISAASIQTNAECERKRIVHQLNTDIKRRLDELLAVLKAEGDKHNTFTSKEEHLPAFTQPAMQDNNTAINSSNNAPATSACEDAVSDNKENTALPFSNVRLKYNTDHNITDDEFTIENITITADKLEQVSALLNTDTTDSKKLEYVNSIIEEIQQDLPTVTQSIVNSEEYFKFGAGVTRKTEDFVITLPSGYIADDSISDESVLMYFADAGNTTGDRLLLSSPLVVYFNKYSSSEAFGYCEFFNYNIKYCIENSLLYKQTVVGGCPAVIKHKKGDSTFDVAVFNYNVNKCYDFKFQFNVIANNKSSVVQRILAGIRFGGER